MNSNNPTGNKPASEAPVRLRRVVRHSKRNLAWAERELMKMQDEETDPQLRALWSTAARIARERISHGKAVVPNDPSSPATVGGKEHDGH